MSARRGTTRYNDGCRAFVAFAVSNCTAVDGKIYCPCKYCRNIQRFWYMHGETTTGSAIRGQCSSYHSGTDTASCSTEHGEVTEHEGVAVEQDDDMHAMLRDAFGVHDVVEAVSTEPQQVDEDTSCGDAGPDIGTGGDAGTDFGGETDASIGGESGPGACRELDAFIW